MSGGGGFRNVLVSSAGRRVHLVELLRSALRRLDPDARVLAADVQPLASALHRADEAVLLPHAASPAFAGAVLGLCRSKAIGLVVPTIDTELAVYAELAPALAALGTTVAVSSPETVAIAGSKRATHQWLVAHGFPAPRQWAPGGPAGADFPLIVKPDAGSSSVGLRQVEDEAELDVAIRVGDVVIEAVAPGVELTVDVFVDRHGRAHAAVPRRRLEVRAGEVSKGLTVHLPAVEALVLRLAEELPGARGCLNVQVFHDVATEETSVIEINARFGGGYPLTDHAGAPHATWLLEEALGRPPSIPDAPAWRADTLMLRYDDAVFIEGWRG